MNRLNCVFIVILTGILSCGTVASASVTANDNCESLLRPFLVTYDADTSAWLDQFRAPGFILESLDYTLASGYMIDDSSEHFLPAIKPLPKTSRLIRQTSSGVEIERGVPFDFLVQLHEQGTAAIVPGYDNSIQSDLAMVVREVERSLSKEFSSVGIVRDEKTGSVLGFLRLYVAHFEGQRVILPAFEIARRLGNFRPEDEALAIELFAPESEGQTAILGYSRHKLIEFGQYSIDHNCSANTRRTV